MRRHLTFWVVVLGLLTAASPKPAAGQTYAKIDFPGSNFTLAVDVTDSGQMIVGRYNDSAGTTHGYLLSNGSFMSITFPGSFFTRAIGINRYGDIVGDYFTKGSGTSNEHGYLLRNGVFTTIDFPNADNTLAEGINSNGDIVGWYIDKNGTHGFLLRGGVYTAINFPGAVAFTETWKINDVGDIAGRYVGATDGKYHVFLLSHGTFTPLPDFPGAAQTAPGSFAEAGGINYFDHIVTHYCSSTPCDLFNKDGDIHGFLLRGGIYTAIDVPGATLTLAYGVNSSDQVVGGYVDSTGIHGYLRTP